MNYFDISFRHWTSVYQELFYNPTGQNTISDVNWQDVWNLCEVSAEIPEVRGPNQVSSTDQ